MPPLYNFEFWLNEDVLVAVTFFDDYTDIINAESLAQVGSLFRRNWAREIVTEMTDQQEISLKMLKTVSADNPFAVRLDQENWGSSVAKLVYTDSHILLHIYRLYISFI